MFTLRTVFDFSLGVLVILPILDIISLYLTLFLSFSPSPHISFSCETLGLGLVCFISWLVLFQVFFLFMLCLFRSNFMLP